MVDETGHTDRGTVPDVLDLDPAFEALAHPRRRYLLYTLLEETEWSLWELAGKVAAWESDVPPTEAEVEDVYVSLYHNHIPKLVEDDILDFSEATETITPGRNAHQVLHILENVGGSEDTEQEVHARSDHSEGRT